MKPLPAFALISKCKHIPGFQAILTKENPNGLLEKQSNNQEGARRSRVVMIVACDGGGPASRPGRYLQLEVYSGSTSMWVKHDDLNPVIGLLWMPDS